MRCSKCNEQVLIPNAKFCKKCGTALISEETINLKKESINNNSSLNDKPSLSVKSSSEKKVSSNSMAKYFLAIPILAIIIGAVWFLGFKDNTSNQSKDTTVTNSSSNETSKSETKTEEADVVKQKEDVTNTINKINAITNGEQGQYSIAYQSLTDNNNIEINSRKTKAASVIKVFIMVEAYNQIKSGSLSESREIVLTEGMKVQGSGILLKMQSGTKFTISQLIEYMIADSDNTAANILIDILGMNNINNTIQSLGCTDTSLQRKMMDLDSINRGIDNFTSVKDLIIVFNKLYRNTYLGQEYDSKMIEVLKKQKNTEKIPALLPQGVSVAHKTGELEKVENDAGIVFTDKGAYIVCFLTEGTPSVEAKKNISEISKLLYEFNSSSN